MERILKKMGNYKVYGWLGFMVEEIQMIGIIARTLIIIGFVLLVLFCAYGAGWRAREEKDNGSLDRQKGD